MELSNDDTNVQTEGLQEKVTFSIEKNKEAFRFLSSGLYSNKIRAVIRELSCNAVDAHTLVGTSNVPIEVKIPNSIDPMFYVKDFGPGLTHEQVMSLYTTYFKSTKQQSNEMIGGLGVGSKSPFAYTKMYTIESRMNGESRTYTAFVENDEPQCALMGTAPTDEPDGLTVSFVARKRDFWSFSSEAQEVFQWFKTPPVLKGMDGELKPVSYTVATSLVSFPTTLSHYRQNAYVRMGGVVYPIARFGDQISDNDHDRPAFNWVVGAHALIEAPIGTLRKAASGEELDYDSKTIAALRQMFATAYVDGTDHVLKQVMLLDPSKWEDRKAGHGLLERARMGSLWHSTNVGSRYDTKAPLLNDVAARAGVDPDRLAPFVEKLASYDWGSFSTLRLAKASLERGKHRKKPEVHQWQDIEQPGRYKENSAELPNFHADVRIFVDDVPVKNRWARKAWETWQKNVLPASESSHYLFVIQPKDGKLGTPEFEEERKLVMQLLCHPRELGALSSGLTYTDKQAFLERSEQSVQATVLGKDKPARVYDNKPFYWIGLEEGNEKTYTDGADSQFGEAGRHFLGLLKEESFVASLLRILGIPEKQVRLIAEADIPSVRTFDNASSLLQTMVTALQSKKVLATLDAIVPVLDAGVDRWGTPNNLVAELLYRSQTNGGILEALDGTGLGTYVKNLHSYNLGPANLTTKKLMSFTACLNALAGNPVTLPAKYYAVDAKAMLMEKYPLLGGGEYDHMKSKPEHLRAYVQWCEAQYSAAQGASAAPSI
jgi:hypothetical protein